MTEARSHGGPHRDLRGKRVLVMGLGRFGGGLGATRYLLGLEAEVTVTDRAPEATLAESLGALGESLRERVTWRLGEHREADFEAADVVVVNQAVPPGNHLVERARAAGAQVTSELELFLEACPATLALVTGTQGKSSTATLLAGLAGGSSHFRRVFLGGNIGRSLLDDLETMGPGDLAVVEVSSYQLEALGRPPARAAVAVITNLLEDHLERHGDLERYHAAKLRVLELLEPGGRAVLPLAGAPAGPTGQTWSHGGPGADLQVDERGFRLGDQLLAPLAALTLPARFQRANALVALGAAHALGLEPAHLAARLPGLRGPAYRAEELGRFGAGAWRVIDNGVSTTPDSTASVLEDLEGPVALLVGGRSKGQDLGPLVECARGRVARVAAFGAAAAELAEAFSVLSAPVTRHATVEEAVARTFADLGPDELLLFSPACSSFDAYNNFEERVRAFRACLPPAP